MRRTAFYSALFIGLATLMFLSSAQPRASAHCEVPCGIYDDHARIVAMLEDTTTIAKAIDHINKLAGAHDGKGMNQSMRWVMNKELHAENIQETMSRYFLAQRVKPVAQGVDGYDDYVTSLVEHHAVIVAAMKTKQDSNPETAVTLRAAIERIGEYYPPSHEH